MSEQIKDLFEDGFIKDFFQYTINNKTKDFQQAFCNSRITLMQRLWRDDKLLLNCTFMGTVNLPLRPSSKLSFDEYKIDMFDFSLRYLMYKHYNFCKKKNISKLLRYIKPITNRIFNQYIEEYQKRCSSNIFEIKRKLTKGEIRYYVILDILNSFDYITADIIKKFQDKEEELAEFCVGKVQGNIYASNKHIEKLLKPPISRKDTDIDYSNLALARRYSQYIDYINEINETEDFISKDYWERMEYINNLDIDDAAFSEYICSIQKDEFTKPERTIALNILEDYCSIASLDRSTIRKRIENGNKEIKNKALYKPNILAKFDEKILNILNPTHFFEPEKVQVFEYLQLLSKDLSKIFPL